MKTQGETILPMRTHYFRTTPSSIKSLQTQCKDQMLLNNSAPCPLIKTILCRLLTEDSFKDKTHIIRSRVTMWRMIQVLTLWHVPTARVLSHMVTISTRQWATLFPEDKLAMETQVMTVFQDPWLRNTGRKVWGLKPLTRIKTAIIMVLQILSVQIKSMTATWIKWWVQASPSWLYTMSKISTLSTRYQIWVKTSPSTIST